MRIALASPTPAIRARSQARGLQRPLCYDAGMTKGADKPQRTTLIPVTTMEEVPVLSAGERAELTASLAEAEREIAEGRGAAYDTEETRWHFMRGFEGRKTPPASA
jgi:hypothetical protein